MLLHDLAGVLDRIDHHDDAALLGSLAFKPK
jgi:hypothetical protein